MASNFKLGTAARNAAADALATYIESGGGHGRIEIYTGSPPTNVADALTGTLLATNTFSNGWYAATGGMVEPDSPSAGIAPASGDAGYFRIYRFGDSGTGPAVCQGTAGESADTPDAVFSEKTIVVGCSVTCSYLRITVPIT